MITFTTEALHAFLHLLHKSVSLSSANTARRRALRDVVSKGVTEGVPEAIRIALSKGVIKGCSEIESDCLGTVRSTETVEGKRDSASLGQGMRQRDGDSM